MFYYQYWKRPPRQQSMREYLVYRYSDSPTYWGPWGEKRQTACKPGSCRGPHGPRDGHSSGTPVTGRLARPTRAAGPETNLETVLRPPPRRPYLVLLPEGFAMPPPLPGARCALTAPFHPCSPALRLGTSGLLSVALSLGLPPPGVTRLRASEEPGLSSAARPRRRRRPSGRLARPDYARARTRSSPSQDCPSASACTWPMTAAVPASISPLTRARRKCR